MILTTFIIMSIRLKKGKYNIIWPVCVLKYCLPMICCTFFGHTFLLLISIFKCLKGTLYYFSNASCEINTLFYFNAPLSVIIILLQILLSYLTISMYYNADFIPEGNNILKKRNSIPEVIFLFCKIIIIITFGFDKESKAEHWGILFVISFITGLNVYGNFFLQQYENIILKKIHDFLSLFLFWGYLCLSISNLFISFDFQGGFYLFILGLILIIIYCVFYSKTYREFIHFNINEMGSSNDCLNFIKEYLNIIKQKEVSRDHSLILSTFIEKVEEQCTNDKCPLKSYLLSLSKGFDSYFLLLQYAQQLFRSALNKYSEDLTLKIHYSIFLLTKIKQKKNAIKVLSSVKSNIFFIDNNFKIYRCKRYIEEYNSINNLEHEEGIDINDIFQEMEYKNNVKEFRNLLSKSSSLYYEFWSSLYSSHLQGTEDFKTLNDIGAELNELIEKIDNIFGKLYEMKNNDLAVIKIYESYIKNILNDKEKYEKYNNLSMNLIMDNKIENREKDYSNFDLKIINETDEYKFLIISANHENRGTIINISLNACPITGYHKHEIIGKNMNILIPEIYHKRHNKLFNEMTEKTKTEFYENLSKKIVYTPKFEEFSAFGRNKAKYLIPFDFKIFFVQTEDSELVYVVDFAPKKSYNSTLNENEKEQMCCVLTDSNFMIQTFTPNCVEILGLNSNIINSNYDITNFIKQFNDEYQTMATNNDFSEKEKSEMKSNENSKDFNNNNYSNEQSFDKLKLKRKLIRLKYSIPRRIIWKMKKNNNNDDFENNLISSLFSPKKIYNINEIKNKSEKRLFLEVKEAFISGKHIGYYFYFKNVQINLNTSENPKKYEESKSPKNKPNLKRPSVKNIKFEEESCKSSRIYNKEEINSILNKANFSKVMFETKKRNSKVNFDLDNYHIAGTRRKNESAKRLTNIFDDHFFIGPKYIPKSNFNFLLDLENLSFKPSKNVKPCQELYNLLRYQSLEKLNIISKNHGKKENSSITSKTENSSKEYISNSKENDSYITSSQYSQSSLSDNQKNKKLNEKNKTKKGNKKGSLFDTYLISHKNNYLYLKNTINNGVSDVLEHQYYKVNIKKIKFMIYDFNQEMVINIDNEKEKKSQMEIIKENYKLNINMNEDINYPSISFTQFTKESKDKNAQNNNNKKNISNKKTEKQDMFVKEKEFEKEISYALKKKDELKSIIFFYKISFLFFVMILLMSIYEIYFIIQKYLKLKENFKLVMDAANLRYFTNFGIYYLREKILYDIDNNITGGLYNISDDNPDIYKHQINDIAKQTFMDCNSILESIIGTTLDFSNKTNYILTEQPFFMKVLFGYNKKIKNVTTNLYSAMIQIYSSFCNLLIKTDSITVEDPNLFNFIHNSFNNLGNGLYEQLQLFINELYLRQSNLIKNIIVYSCIYLVVHIIIYFMIYKSYCSIVTKKTSYIEVFYGIGLSLIKTSIKKCEIFINKINQDDENSKIRGNDDENSSFISSSDIENISFEKNFEKKKIVNNKKKSKKLKNNRKLGDDRKSKIFRIITQLSLILSYIYLVVIFCTYLLLIEKFIFNAKYLLYMQDYHNNIIELFNGYREYLFDENTIIYGLPAYDYLLKKEETFYLSNTETVNYSYLLTDVISELNNKYAELHRIGLCGYYITNFNSIEECENFLGGKNGIISFGFHILINYFIEEVRNARNYMKKLLDQKILVGNLSEEIDIHFDDTNFGLDKNKTLQFRMAAFNLEQTHSRLNIIFMNVVLQYINQARNVTINTIVDNVTNGHIKYVIIMFIYILLFLIIFFYYWIPMIRRMNTEIYKTKNMLSIIPLQILASQPNIKILLNISTSND